MAASKRRAPSARARGFAALHAGKRALGWDDEMYRGYLEQLTGKRSASDLTDTELARVLDDMRVRGFQRKEGSAPQVPQERATQLQKARAVWGELADLGALQSPTEAGFCAYVERMTRRSRPEWCTPPQLSTVIEGLKAWGTRARLAAMPDDKRPLA